MGHGNSLPLGMVKRVVPYVHIPHTTMPLGDLSYLKVISYQSHNGKSLQDGCNQNHLTLADTIFHYLSMNDLPKRNYKKRPQFWKEKIRKHFIFYLLSSHFIPWLIWLSEGWTNWAILFHLFFFFFLLIRWRKRTPNSIQAKGARKRIYFEDRLLDVGSLSSVLYKEGYGSGYCTIACNQQPAPPHDVIKNVHLWPEPSTPVSYNNLKFLQTCQVEALWQCC